MSRRRRSRKRSEQLTLGRARAREGMGATVTIEWPDEWADFEPDRREHRPLPVAPRVAGVELARVVDVPCARCRCRASAHGQGGPRAKVGATCMRHGGSCAGGYLAAEVSA
jgi:hypothetical protein